jgi:formylglycine-generating enzyme required for sulfatase activity
MKRLLLSALTLPAIALLAQSPRTLPRMEFVRIQPGEFIMGCSDGDKACEPHESPSHRVQITKAFELGKYEVTQAEYEAVMQTNPSTIKGDRRPVETVSRIDAQQFVDRLNARNDGYRYRLPTEAEWEYAARAGAKTAHTGSLDDVAWHAGNSGDETHPVGQKKPNKWGLYDMEGNVREWVADWYSANYYGNSPLADPTGPPAAQGPGPGGRGGPPPFGRGGPGFRGGRGGPPPEPPGPIQLPPCDGQGTQPEELKREIDCLRQQIAVLAERLQFGGPPPFGPPGGGPNGLGVMRGGAWDNLENFVRLSARYNYYGIDLKVSDVGFRVARETIQR